ncbi:hypothetical protein PHLCEN_2v951 [Hermanssonia centrifuga]|uniref:Uncharacterized protein n=1 Tax=Hermanssonia centrifuga TaxID=98765 RepID=A0A2R6S4I6_9APHY|nr:hypothetical protein PHLCEN_2v951 [Hermanssonia centrifuga]
MEGMEGMEGGTLEAGGGRCDMKSGESRRNAMSARRDISGVSKSSPEVGVSGDEGVEGDGSGWSSSRVGMVGSGDETRGSFEDKSKGFSGSFSIKVGSLGGGGGRDVDDLVRRLVPRVRSMGSGASPKALRRDRVAGRLGLGSTMAGLEFRCIEGYGWKGKECRSDSVSSAPLAVGSR